MNIERCSGILLHPTSLPGKFGVGSFDKEAYDWVDFLHDTQQTIWQVLPMGPTSYGDSPYQSYSTHAGNPYLIGLESMATEGLLDANELLQVPQEAFATPTAVNYEFLFHWKIPVLQRAAQRFLADSKNPLVPEFRAFCRENSHWLDDYALFMALKDAFDSKSWQEWPDKFRTRQPAAIAEAKRQHANVIEAYRFIQWMFFRQWKRLRQYANKQGIKILGDLPIFVAMDSADAWTAPELFYFDKNIKPTVVAGVPPDYFAVDGQLWGNPLYRWPAMRKNGYKWWLNRIKSALAIYDMVRIDHFRGFAAYWEVAADAKTARKGRWVKGPGKDFFTALRKALGNDLPIVAEDLGQINEPVRDLRDSFGLPGMKILQFAFDGRANNAFLPHNYSENFIAYTGTHDNDTSRGWYENSSKPEERDCFRRYFSTDGWDMAWTLIRGVFSSVARVAIVPLQDILDMNSDARMNTPGQASGNWQWRFLPGAITPHISQRLKDLTLTYGRECTKVLVPDETDTVGDDAVSPEA